MLSLIPAQITEDTPLRRGYGALPEPAPMAWWGYLRDFDLKGIRIRDAGTDQVQKYNTRWTRVDIFQHIAVFFTGSLSLLIAGSDVYKLHLQKIQFLLL